MFSPLPVIVYVPFAASNSMVPLCSTFPTSPVPSKIPTAPDSAASTETPSLHHPQAAANSNTTKHTTTHIFRLPLSMEFLLGRKRQLWSRIPSLSMQSALRVPLPLVFCLYLRLKTYNFSRPARLTRINRQVLPSLSRSCLPLLVNPLFPTPIRLKYSATVASHLPLPIRLRPGPTKVFRGSADDKSKWGRSASRALAVPKSNRGAPHVCSRCLKRSIPSPELLIRKIQRTEFQAGISATRPGPSVGQSLPGSVRPCLPSNQQCASPFFFLFLERPRFCLQPTGYRPQIRQPLRCPAALHHCPAGSPIFRRLWPPSSPPPSSLRRLGHFLQLSEFSRTAFLPGRPGSAIRQSFQRPICLRFPATGIRSAWLCANHFRHFLFFLRLE